jgi:sec-independent protein translocase protein TatA
VKAPREKELLMFGLGYQELLIILVIVLILFGANRLPELARSLGSSVKEFKKGVNEAKVEDTSATRKEEEEKKEA